MELTIWANLPCYECHYYNESFGGLNGKATGVPVGQKFHSLRVNSHWCPRSSLNAPRELRRFVNNVLFQYSSLSSFGRSIDNFSSEVLCNTCLIFNSLGTAFILSPIGHHLPTSVWNRNEIKDLGSLCKVLVIRGPTQVKSVFTNVDDREISINKVQLDYLEPKTDLECHFSDVTSIFPYNLHGLLSHMDFISNL